VAAEEQLLIFERHFSAEKLCRPPSGWGIMPSACFSAPLPRGLVEGASDGRYPQRSRPSKQRGKNRQMALALRVAEIQAKGHKAFGFVAWHGGQLCWLGGLLARPLLRIRYGSPLRGCSREAALPAAHGLPGRCFASATAFRNGLYAIKSALPLQ
jgi:hypothetical protein